MFEPIEINENSKELVRGHGEFIKYETEIKPEINIKADFLELAKSRRSIRKYKNEKDNDVSKEQLMKLIDAAQAAPSARNCQPWHFYVVKNKKIQAELKECAYNQDFILNSPACIIICADSKRNESRYGERGKNLYCIQDTAAAVQNILLCAKDMGLGTCWVGAFDEAKAAKILNLPEDFRPVAIIPVGCPAEDFKPQHRRPVDEIVTFINE